MKKIIIFGYTLDVGGAEKVLVDYINILKDRGYEIDLALLQKRGAFLNDLPEGVNVYEMRKNILSYCGFRFVPFIRKRAINALVKDKNYDVAIGFFEGRSASWVADIESDIKRIAWVHNDVDKFDIGISDKEAMESYAKMDRIVVVSERAKEIFCKKYKFDLDRVEVLYNLVDEEAIVEKAKEDVPKNDVFTFVNVGKMRYQKRQDRLIEIAKKLKADGFDFKIQIIGNGPEEEKIKEMIKTCDVEDKVELLGLKTNPYPYVKQADCFVLSSDFEGYVIAVKEALVLKQIVISTDVTGAREMLENSKYGILVNVDTEEIYKAMKDMLEGKIDTKTIKKNLENFDCGNGKIIEKLIDIIEN